MRKIRGYSTAWRAVQGAKRKNEFGLTGSGQFCGPVELESGGWGFWTAHSVFDREVPGRVLLPGGRYIPGDDWRDYLQGSLPWAELPVWKERKRT